MKTFVEYNNCYHQLKDTIGALKLKKTQLELKVGPAPTDTTNLVANADPADQLDDVSSKKNISCCYCCMYYNRNSNRQKIYITSLQIIELEEIRTKFDNMLKFRHPVEAKTWGDTFEQVGKVVQAVRTYGVVDGLTDDPCMTAFSDLKKTLAKYDKHHIVMQGVRSPTRSIINRLRDLVEQSPFIIEEQRLSHGTARDL